MNFFIVAGISKRTLSFIFILKIFAGVALWAIYTFYYKDRATSDIYKYFDASKVMFDTLKTNPTHFLKMLTGIGNDTDAFTSYYDKMNFWSRQIERAAQGGPFHNLQLENLAAAGAAARAPLLRQRGANAMPLDAAGVGDGREGQRAAAVGQIGVSLCAAVSSFDDAGSCAAINVN